MTQPAGPPREDSEDLTDEEIATALPSGNADHITAKLLEHECSACRASKTRLRHELRRRVPHLYWRVVLPCGERLVFQATWVHEQGEAG